MKNKGTKAFCLSGDVPSECICLADWPSEGKTAICRCRSQECSEGRWYPEAQARLQEKAVEILRVTKWCDPEMVTQFNAVQIAKWRKEWLKMEEKL